MQNNLSIRLFMLESTPILPEDRDGFRFRGGHVALDLAATLAARFKDEPRELLARPADLDRWLTSSGLAVRPPRSTEAELQLARSLREAVYMIATGDDSAAARKRLNTAAALTAAKPQLSAAGKLQLLGDAGEILATVAREAVALFGSAERSRIRQCDGDGCAILYLDLSRSGRRRWCSMSGCGNRAKAREFRKRRGED